MSLFGKVYAIYVRCHCELLSMFIKLRVMDLKIFIRDDINNDTSGVTLPIHA
jgi:hypothetical protein